MFESFALLASAVALGAAAAAAAWWPRRHPATVKRVLINFTTPDADALRGVLVRQTGPWLVLARAELVRPDGSVPLDGEVLLERDRVLFLQVLP